MSIHINANYGDIAKKVLLPGDPLRARFIAEHFLENVTCYSSVRNMYGFTGTYKGQRVSVQGTGMGMPSLGIYARELIEQFGCETLIRTGTCGAYDCGMELGDVLLVQAAATDSSIAKQRFGNLVDFPIISDFNLLVNAYENAKKIGCRFRVGTVLTSDLFYLENDEESNIMQEYGVCAADMECAELFMLGLKFKVRTLGILTVSDIMSSHTGSTVEEREKAFTNMVKIALETN